jgi:sugar (pentulose or hexulose) kinase
LANFARAQVYAVFATLSLGMALLTAEKVRVDELVAHGGLFRTPGPAQQVLASSLGVPIAVERTAGEGGAWGIALLAGYLGASDHRALSDFLTADVFHSGSRTVVGADSREIDGFASFLDRYRLGLELEQSAVRALPGLGGSRNGETA